MRGQPLEMSAKMPAEPTGIPTTKRPPRHRPIRLAYDATSYGEGGALTSLIGLLEAWRDIDAPLEICVHAARAETIEVVTGRFPEVELSPFVEARSSAVHFTRQWLALGRRIERGQPDVLLSTQWLLGRCSIPQVVHHRNQLRFQHRSVWTHGMRGQPDESFRDLLARRSLWRAPANVFVSHFMRARAEELVPPSAPRNHVIYHGLRDIERTRLRSLQRRPAESLSHLVAIQGTYAHKDNETLLRVLRELKAISPEIPWRLSIAGTGDWRPMVEKARAHGLEGQVSFLGYRSQEELDHVFKDALCMVCTSRLESFCLPLLESMARGCPVVTSNAAAIPEIAGEAALFVEPGDVMGFAEAIVQLRRDASLRNQLIDRGLRRIEHFSWRTTARRFVEIFERVAASTCAADGRPRS